MRRRLLLAAPLALLLTLLVLGLWLSSGRGHRITRESFARIQEGMTKEQVDAVLGKDLAYATGFGPAGPATVFYCEAALDSLRPSNIILVTFKEGKVASKNFQPWTVAEFL
jgi:outer membrane protein assembly factor BamE (lipoprotein component of BamABCDE complex)